jgi:aminoglycoside phosphotransferase (APT) family kinase protein
MHADQLAVSAAMVRELVDEQFPRWRELNIKAVESPGTINAIFRIGDQLAARFPLRLGDAAAVRRRLESEAAAARELAGRTRFATPEPVAIGEPGAGYPLPWAVQTWLSGDTASDVDPGASVPFAHDMAEFIAGVRTIDTRGRTFSGKGRGGDLRSHDEWMQTCFERSEHLLNVPRLRRLWEAMRALPRGTAGDVMSHCDLIPGNVLVSGGRLAGVLDVGDLGPADPALDLVAAWHLLEAGPRQALRDDLRCDDLEWERGQAWAFQQAMGLVWYYQDSNPAMSRLGRRTLERIQAGAPLPPSPEEEVTEAALRRAAE